MVREATKQNSNQKTKLTELVCMKVYPSAYRPFPDRSVGFSILGGPGMDYSKENDRKAIKSIIRQMRKSDTKDNVSNSELLCGVILIIVMLACLATCSKSFAMDYTDAQVADAIYHAEGGENAKKPFGILSVSCNGYEECRRICLNTVRNNRKRFSEYGHKRYPDYLSFLASRYAPIGAENDPTNLNKNWIKNVKHFLANPKAVR